MCIFTISQSLFIFILNILNSFNILWKKSTNLTSLFLKVFIWIFLRIIWKGYFLLNLLRGRPSQVAMVGSLKTNNLKILCILLYPSSRRFPSRFSQTSWKFFIFTRRSIFSSNNMMKYEYEYDLSILICVIIMLYRAVSSLTNHAKYALVYSML